MNKPRKTNIINALQNEIKYYKSQYIKYKVVNIPLHHLRIKSYFSQSEVMDIPKDYIPEILIMRMSRAFGDIIEKFPIKIDFNEKYNNYEATLDLWVDINNTEE